MKTKKVLLNELNNYFEALCQNEEVSETETINALYVFLDYCLREFDLDVMDYDILIHANSTLSKDNEILAYVEPNEKYENKYDIHLNKANMKIPSLLEFGKLLDVFVSAAHEFKHIIQYETTPGIIFDSNATFCEIYTEIANATDVKDKKLLNLLLRYEKTFGVISNIEKDADKFAYMIVQKLLLELKQNSTEDGYTSFLNCALENLNELKNARQAIWKKYYKNYANIKKIMHKCYNYETTLN